MRITISFLLLMSLAACASEPIPLENISSEDSSSTEQENSLPSPSSLSEAGADLAPLPPTRASLPVRKSFRMTASHAGFNPSIIEVNQGDSVSLALESIDSRHSFSIPALGIRTEIPARETTTLEFIASKKGQFEFLSDVYSGANTENMRGVLIVK